MPNDIFYYNSDSYWVLNFKKINIALNFADYKIFLLKRCIYVINYLFY